jgi:hypothetical protein
MTEADSGKADTVNMNVSKVYGTGIAFHEHYILTTGDVARHAKKLAAIVVMVNNTPVVARVERSADTLFNKEKNEYLEREKRCTEDYYREYSIQRRQIEIEERQEIEKGIRNAEAEYQSSMSDYKQIEECFV